MWRTLIFMGPNSKTTSGVSWKIWRVRRSGVRVHAEWGAGTVERRRARFVRSPQAKTWTLRNVEAAVAEMARRIARKHAKGYKTLPRHS